MGRNRLLLAMSAVLVVALLLWLVPARSDAPSTSRPPAAPRAEPEAAPLERGPPLRAPWEAQPPDPTAPPAPPATAARRVWVHGRVLGAEGRKVGVDACGARLRVEPDGRFSDEIAEDCALRAIRFGDALRAFGPAVLPSADVGQDALVELELPDEGALEPYTAAEIQQAREMVDRAWALCIETLASQPPDLDCQADIGGFYRDIDHMEAVRRARASGPP